MRIQTNTQKPTIAIAGTSGRFGSRLNYYLSPHYNIVSLERAVPSRPNNLTTTIVRLDITDKNSVHHAIKELKRIQVRTLINCIGDLNVDAEEHTRGNIESNMYRVNTEGPDSLARACHNENIKLIHLSTEYVFDGRKQVGLAYAETDEPNTSLKSAPTWYGITKALGEKKVLAAHLRGAVIVRFSQIQSPVAGLFASTITKLRLKQKFTRAHNQMMSPLCDTTAAAAILSIEKAMHEKNFHGIIHVGARDTHSCYEVSLMLARVYGLQKLAEKLITPVSLEELVASGEQKVLRPYNPVLNSEKFNTLFSPKIPTVKAEIDTFHSLYAKDY